MDQQNAFSYTYSAPENQEVLRIRKKYLPQEETKLEDLKRLDQLVHRSGTIQALCVGVISCLIFGTGMCFSMKVLGDALWLGILLGIVGTAGMLAAFPVYRKYFNQAKAQYAPRILQLTAEITGEIL